MFLRLNSVPNTHVTALCYCKLPFHSKPKQAPGSRVLSFLFFSFGPPHHHLISLSFLHPRPRSYARSIAGIVIVFGQSPTRNPQASASHVIAIRYAPASVSIPHSVNPALMLHSPPPSFSSHSSSGPTQKRPSPRAVTSTVQIAIIGTAEPEPANSAGASTHPVTHFLPPPHVRLPPSRLVCKYARIRPCPSIIHHISVSHVYVIQSKYPM
jgi:hypothetical protein